jgi:hypothetical protein
MWSEAANTVNVVITINHIRLFKIRVSLSSVYNCRNFAIDDNYLHFLITFSLFNVCFFFYTKYFIINLGGPIKILYKIDELQCIMMSNDMVTQFFHISHKSHIYTLLSNNLCTMIHV